MVVELAEEVAAAAPAAPKTIFDRITPGGATIVPAKSAVGPRNNKEGLFGTAMQDEDDDQQMMQEAHNTNTNTNTNFSVTFGGSGGRAGQPAAALGGRSPFGHRSVTANAAPKGGGGGGNGGASRGGPRGGGRGKAGRAGSSSESKPKGREVGLNLDDDLDAYMKKR